MRAALGLSPPERRIGQTAHDFVAALGAPRGHRQPRAEARRRANRRLALSPAHRRRRRRDPRTPPLETRGARYLALARALDRPAAYRPRRRPEPRPPLDLRPHSLSVTRIETLRRDPYAIFAERVLELEPLAPVGPVIGPREIGDLWHAALQAYGEAFADGASSAVLRARLIAFAEKQFAAPLADPTFRALRWPRIVAGLDAFLGFRRRAAHRRPNGCSSNGKAGSNSRSTTARDSR